MPKVTWQTGACQTLADWMNAQMREMTTKGLKWTRCNFRTDDDGRFTYTEDWN